MYVDLQTSSVGPVVDQLTIVSPPNSRFMCCVCKAASRSQAGNRQPSRQIHVRRISKLRLYVNLADGFELIIFFMFFGVPSIAWLIRWRIHKLTNWLIHHWFDRLNFSTRKNLTVGQSVNKDFGCHHRRRRRDRCRRRLSRYTHIHTYTYIHSLAQTHARNISGGDHLHFNYSQVS